MSDIDHTANLILNRTEDTESRVNGYYVHLRHLKAMAGLWKLRKTILAHLKDGELIREIKALEETNENKQ